MKFGNNLAYLSIPEWRGHNLDYNELKSEIREVTRLKEDNLRPLYSMFMRNFEYVNLFIATKYGELNRKLDFYESSLEYINISSSLSTEEKRAKIDEILYHVLDIAMNLKNLSKFILIQKIACLKIFKKFVKYYYCENKAKKFIIKLKQQLQANEYSFVNFDLSGVTLKVTSFIGLLKHLLKNVEDIVPRKPLRSYPSSIALSSQLLSNFPSHNAHEQQIPPTESSKFDLTTFLKKNFCLDFLTLDDSNSLNEIILNLNVVMGLESYNSDTPTMVSFIYLQNDNLVGDPSYILSQENESFSTLIAYVGGLRKYSYCVLPNSFIQVFLNYMGEEDEEASRALKTELKTYFEKNKVTFLTKTTIDTILLKKKVPKLKLVCKRTRYLLKKEVDESDGQSHRSLNSETSSVKRNYQDDYLATLDSAIYTTDDMKKVSSLDFEVDHYDKFPYNHLTVYSNDSNLSNFIQNLDTKLENSHLTSTYSNSLLRKLPPKIQGLIRNDRSFNLFKNMHFYHYMSTCYFNMIPPDNYINNHYSFLLNLNLFKNFENVTCSNTQKGIEDAMMKPKLNQFSQDSKLNSIRSNDSSNNNSIFTSKSHSNADLNSEQDTNDINWSLEEQYLMELQNASLTTNSKFGNLMSQFIKFKGKLSSPKEHTPLVDDIENNYDSMNEEILYYPRRKYEDSVNIQYERYYDSTLSYAYLSLLWISLFISGVESGIIYTITKVEEKNAGFSLRKSIWLIMILIIGLLSSLFFSLVSINLNFQRFTPAPTSHSVVIWTGFFVVCTCSVWSAIVLLQM
ncbi:uncharacterized protein PRCAT00002772001 [Priceomyces carsonii]|uniref:uncharacterized protein n=1 Tax=Priceomyces carsonii TaxID=28549 RepID=UPI002EDA7D3B|nr:unnamed protein product [Priceomyces carsonii]